MGKWSRLLYDSMPTCNLNQMRLERKRSEEVVTLVIDGAVEPRVLVGREFTCREKELVLF